MNRRLTDHHIRSTCRDLLSEQGPSVTGRALRRTLKTRYGAVGKTERVFRIWRELVQTAAIQSGPALPTDVAELQRRLITAEEGATLANARAALAQLREQSHQDKWALEIDRLRLQLGSQPATLHQVRMLEDQVQRLKMDLMSARAMLARYEEANELLTPSRP